MAKKLFITVDCKYCNWQILKKFPYKMTDDEVKIKGQKLIEDHFLKSHKFILPKSQLTHVKHERKYLE